MDKINIFFQQKLTKTQIALPMVMFLFMAGSTVAAGILNTPTQATSTHLAVQKVPQGTLSAYGDQTCTSVKHGDITWTFSSAVKCGQFANGEPWVVGPVTVTSISPAPYVIPAHMDGNKMVPDWDMNGSMVNPVPAQGQGFSQQIDIFYAKNESIEYVKSKNAALLLPNLVLKPNDVLVSSKVGQYPNGRGTNFLESISALTVLPSVPAEGSFRPSIYGTDRTIRWNTNQINWDVLKNLPAVSGTPNSSLIYSSMPNLPWIEWTDSWIGGNMMPVDNTSDGLFYNNPVGQNSSYGREIAYKFGAVALWLNTDQNISDKKAIAIRMIQNGIDIYEYLKYPGAGFYHDGGHKAGRKLPVVIAAAMLNDANIKTLASNPDRFQEDTQTFFVTQADVGRELGCYKYKDGVRTYCRQQYIQSDVGMAEWGIRHRFEPYQDDKSWNANGEYDYRNTNYPAVIAPVLAAELMGLQSLWNHPALFAYTTRHYNATGAASLPFLNNMYIKYKLGGTLPTNTPETPTNTSGNTNANTSLTTPTITTPTTSTIPSTNSVTINWTSDANAFLTRFAEVTSDGTLIGTALMNNSATTKSATYTVVPGKYYKFWVHAGTLANYSPQDEINFKVLENSAPSVVETKTYTLTVSTTGTGAGEISGVSQNITTHEKDSVVTLTAQTGTNSTFTGWSGACSGTSNTCTVSMGADKVVSANFDSTLVPEFTVGDTVSAIRNTNVRSTPALNGTNNLIGTQKTTTKGKVTSLHTTADNIVWYYIDYETGTDGYSGQDNFIKIQNENTNTDVPTQNPTIPTPPATLSLSCTVSDTDIAIGEGVTIDITTYNLPAKYKLSWSGISTSKVKGLNKKAFDQTLLAKKKGTLTPRIEVKNSSNSREKVKLTCPSIVIR